MSGVFELAAFVAEKGDKESLNASLTDDAVATVSGSGNGEDSDPPPPSWWW